VKSLLKEEYVIENIVVGQMINEEDTLADIMVKLNFKINVKIKQKTRVIQNTCHGALLNGWSLNLANLSETRTLCNLFLTDPMISVIYFIFVPHLPTLIFGRKISCKTSIQTTVA